MKEKLKEKFLDTIATFFGSLLALAIFSKVKPVLEPLFINLEWKQSTIKITNELFLALFISVGFLCMYFLFFIAKKIFSVFQRPKILVSFLNEKDHEVLQLSLRDEPEEPHYLKICLRAKFNRIQIWFITEFLEARLLIQLNPKMASIELAEGFIRNNKDFQDSNQYLSFDFFSKYSSSNEYKSINMELNLLLVQSAEGEIKMNLDLSKSRLWFKSFFVNYCVFEMKKFNILG